MQLVRKIIIVTIALSIVAAITALLLPMPSSWQGGWEIYHVPLAFSLPLAFFHIAAAIMFVLGMRGYRKKFRTACTYIAIGLVLLGISSIQAPIANVFTLWETPWVTQGGIIIPIVIAVTALYVGVRKVALLIGLRTLLVNVVLVLVVGATVAVMSTFVPHPQFGITETKFDLGNAILTACAFMFLVMVLLVFMIQIHIGAHYKKAMTWFAAAFATSFVALCLAVLHSYIAGPGQDEWIAAIMRVSAIAGVFYMRAAYLFYKTGDYY